ncbi:hypothetical protein PAPHI01_2510 [Pancytospora philotis]|nr:hypothetical protein PAPHI01_2510 [Pancytospora philotis]
MKGPEFPGGEPSAKTDDRVTAITAVPISWEELRRTVSSCLNGKAVGSDGVPCEVYKIAIADRVGDASLCRAITAIANVVLSTRLIPAEREDCVLVPIFKKGDKASLDNYRGITLINTLSKVSLKALAACLSAAQAAFGIIRREQLGFIEREEGLSGAMTAVEACERRRINGTGTLLLFLDLQKPSI